MQSVERDGRAEPSLTHRVLPPQRLERWLGLAGIFGLLCAATTAFFTRFVWDDFELAWGFRQKGWLGLSSTMYRTYSGRLDLIVFGGALTSVGPAAAMAVGVALLTWWWVTLTVIAKRCLERLGITLSWSRSTGLAAAATAAFLSAVADPFQTTRWLTGVLVYGGPLGLVFTAAALALQPNDRRRDRARVWSDGLRTAAIALCLFFAAGGNETQAVTLPVLCAVLAMQGAQSRADSTKRRRISVQPAIACVAASLGGALLILSPGSRARSGWFTTSHEFGVVLRAAVLGIQVFVGSLINYAAFGLTAIMAMARLVHKHTLARPDAGSIDASHDRVEQSRRLVRTVWKLSGLVSLVAIIAIVAIPAYSLNAPAPLRAYLPSLAALAVFFCASGWLSVEYVGSIPFHSDNSARAGGDTHHRFVHVDQELATVLRVVCVVAAFAGPITLATRHVVGFGDVREEARVWKCVDSTLRRDASLGIDHAVLLAPPMIKGIHFLRDDPTSPPNAMTAGYYGLRSVRATPGDPCLALAAPARPVALGR